MIGVVEDFDNNLIEEQKKTHDTSLKLMKEFSLSLQLLREENRLLKEQVVIINKKLETSEELQKKQSEVNREIIDTLKEDNKLLHEKINEFSIEVKSLKDEREIFENNFKKHTHSYYGWPNWLKTTTPNN
jgi:hypothetical protein